MTWPNLIWASGQWKIEKKEKKTKSRTMLWTFWVWPTANEWYTSYQKAKLARRECECYLLPWLKLCIHPEKSNDPSHRFEYTQSICNGDKPQRKLITNQQCFTFAWNKLSPICVMIWYFLIFANGNRLERLMPSSRCKRHWSCFWYFQ